VIALTVASELAATFGDQHFISASSLGKALVSNEAMAPQASSRGERCTLIYWPQFSCRLCIEGLVVLLGSPFPRVGAVDTAAMTLSCNAEPYDTITIHQSVSTSCHRVSKVGCFTAPAKHEVVLLQVTFMWVALHVVLP
jgi:hypothetical protein